MSDGDASIRKTNGVGVDSWDVSSNPSPRGSVQDLRPCRPQYDGTGTIAGISYGNYTPSKFLHGPLPDAHLYPDGIYLTGIRPSAVAA